MFRLIGSLSSNDSSVVKLALLEKLGFSVS